MDDRGVRLARAAADWSPVGRAAIVLSRVGRGGLPWFALAAAIGAGRRPLSRRDATVVSSASIAVGLTGSSLLARAFGRRRPCDRGVPALVPCPTGSSFPSDQAAASFAAAEVLSWLEPPAGRWFRTGATAVALARVAVGVHYPSDVIAGGLIGAAVGRAGRAAAARRAD